MAKLILNAGTTNNDKTGDTLRAGALKIKANFEEIYTALASNGSNISGGNVLKTGSYNDLYNKPSFSTVAVSGNFFDLEARPDLGVFVGEPPNETGTDGNVFGNMAYASGSFYFCFEDYVQQLSFTGLNALNDNSYHLNIPWLAGYQALLDAFQNSMSLSVNPGTDGNWRNITAISKNTGTNKLSITYEGSNFVDVTTGINVRIDQPQIWKSIPWSPDYSNPFPGISTGDWTWPEGGGGTQALLGGSQNSWIDGQSPGGLLLHNDSMITLQAGDMALSVDAETGSIGLPEGSTITETATTLVLTPPTALAGQGLVIRTTVGGGLFTIDTFTPGSPVTVTFIDSGSHFSSGGYVDNSESNTWAYTITGISEADLGSPLTGSFLAEDWVTNQNVKTFNIPAESTGTGFVITLDKIITEPPYYLGGTTLNSDNRIELTVGSVVAELEISHVHLTTADPTTVDLYLGDDDQYVKIEKNEGDVVIGTNTNTNRWRFDTNGALTLPVGGNILDHTGATMVISLSALKEVVSYSTDFADFQSRIAAL